VLIHRVLQVRKTAFRCADTHVSRFVPMLLLALALTLTLSFEVAAWRQSAGRDVDSTAIIPHQEHGWRAKADR
jgi:hypothetical protein